MINNVKSFEVPDYKWYENTQNITEESVIATVSPYLRTNAGEQKPLTAVCIWGVADCPQLPKNNYIWKLNSPYGGIITEKGAIKTSFDAVYRALKSYAEKN